MDHSNLDFKFDINDLPSDLISRLGKCVNLCNRITHLVSNNRILQRRYMIYLTRSGVCKPVTDDKKLLDARHEGTQALNVLELYNELSARVDRGGQIPITLDEICKSHERVHKDIPQKQGTLVGQIRKGCVRVGRYQAPCGKEAPELMERLLAWLDSASFVSSQGNALSDAIIKAIVFHAYFVSIHPFSDGNGRVARLMQYAILRNAGMHASIAQLLGNHYNETRKQYSDELWARDMGEKDINAFLNYSINGLICKFDEYLEEILQSLPQVLYQKICQEESLLVKGFTVLELVIVISVLAILIGISIPKIKGMQLQGNIAKAHAEVQSLQAALESYYTFNKVYPDTFSRLTTTSPNLIGNSLPTDPFNTPSSYKYALSSGGQYYVVYTIGTVASGQGSDGSGNGGQYNCGIDFGSNGATYAAPGQPTGCKCIYATNAPNVVNE